MKFSTIQSPKRLLEETVTLSHRRWWNAGRSAGDATTSMPTQSAPAPDRLSPATLTFLAYTYGTNGRPRSTSASRQPIDVLSTSTPTLIVPIAPFPAIAAVVANGNQAPCGRSCTWNNDTAHVSSDEVVYPNDYRPEHWTFEVLDATITAHAFITAATPLHPHQQLGHCPIYSLARDFVDIGAGVALDVIF